MKTPKIIVVGSANTDMLVKSFRIPEPGETVTGGTFFLARGGKGGNQAVAAARLGARVVFIARVGCDPFGETAIQGYRDEGVDVDWVVSDPERASGVALIMVDEQGENAISVASGANDALSPEDVLRAEAEFRDADVVLTQLETPLETLRFTTELAEKYRVPVILDPAPAPPTPLSSALLKRIACITPNENETWRLTGTKITDDASTRQAAETLLALGVRSVIVTRGKLGACVVDSAAPTEREVFVHAGTVAALDATAAGDAFAGALAVSLGRGKTLLEASYFAVAAASLSVTRMGAQSSLATLEEVRSFMNSASH